MKKSIIRCVPMAAVALLLAVIVHSPARAQGTEITYQGSLDDGAGAAAGLHDFRFRLFDAASGGSQVGSTICVDDVNVIAGVFTVPLDFGQQYITTANRWLEIEVRHDTGLSCANTTGFTLLTPRQKLTAAPMALHASSAFALDAADGSPTSAVFVDNNGKVGIGTTSPATPLHVRSAGPSMVLQDTAPAANQVGFLSFWNDSSIETGWFGFGAPGSPDLFMVNGRSGGDIRFNAGGLAVLIARSNGRVGIGTIGPNAKLDVRGDILLGASGEFFAPGASENLRVIRGKVSSTGVALLGSGFTSSRTGTGLYSINFSPSFPAVGGSPDITLTAESSSSLFIPMVTLSSPTVATVRIVNGSNTAADATFHFVAAGPR